MAGVECATDAVRLLAAVGRPPLGLAGNRAADAVVVVAASRARVGLVAEGEPDGLC